MSILFKKRKMPSEDCSRRSFTFGDRWDESDAYVVGWGVQRATCSGYFKKENAKTFGFTKRWYQLHGNVLLYYESELKSKAKGVIDVSGAAICIAAVEPFTRKPNGCYADRVLQIKTPARTYTLWPKYNDDLIPWQAAVTEAPACSPSHSVATSQTAVEAARQATVQQLIEQNLGHLYSTPMKVERLAQCCRRLGVREDQEPHLMWLVHEAQRATAADTPVLPGDWQVYRDDDSGQLYYYNAVTQASSWEHPLSSYFDYLLMVLRRETLVDIGAEAAEEEERGEDSQGRRGEGGQGGAEQGDEEGTASSATQEATRSQKTPSPEAMSRTGVSRGGHTFSKVISTVPLCGKRTRPLTIYIYIYHRRHHQR